MDDFKLVRLSASNTKINDEIITVDGTALKAELIDILGLPQGSTGYDIAIKIQKLGCNISKFNMKDDDINLMDIVKKLSLDVPAKVYLNWHHFDTVDIMNFDTLCGSFDDVWYPSSDDIDIVDIDLKWVVCVDHDGYIKKLLLRH